MQSSFNSEELALLTRVVDKACRDIGVCDESIRAAIALKVMAHYADSDQRDFSVLLSIATGGQTTEASHAR
jgi:hypothetical protein